MLDPDPYQMNTDPELYNKQEESQQNSTRGQDDYQMAPTPPTDVSTTPLHGVLDTTRQVTSTASKKRIKFVSIRMIGGFYSNYTTVH
jgi:hypothetical protein